MRRFSMLVLALSLVAGCDRPAEADRQKLIGLWMPEDGSRRTLEFKPDGVFDFRYMATWRLRWELRSASRVALLGGDGTLVNTCTFAVEGDRLTIHDGAGRSCDGPRVTPPSPMPIHYRKAPGP